ncbi:hypothetical protein [Agaribacterium sp. ZY112]|uniref:hypothetical protein n=1 Tax=Agaribacterium sp. ZY112 TaxID=3233574 RepID=UPI003524EF7E
MNLIELGENTDSEYDHEHRCSANKHPKADRLVHCVTAHDEPFDSWQLHNIHYADETEVNLGEADYVGEITYHSMILVNYCPFCGAQLKQS